jgi:3-oxoacyl-[acyl-carrier protein] reductase
MNILITGASRGIGHELAIAFSKMKDIDLFLVSRDLKKLKLLADECKSINHDCEVQVYANDLNQILSVESFVHQIMSECRGIDILINNAGLLINKPYDEFDISEIINTFNVNFIAPSLLIRHILPFMKGRKYAHIVNIGSMGGFQGSSKYRGLSYYSAAKAALSVLTECLAEEYKDYGVAFNCLALGAADTEMFRDAFPNYKAPVNASEMAEFIANFALKGSIVMNGRIIPVTITQPDA